MWTIGILNCLMYYLNLNKELELKFKQKILMKVLLMQIRLQIYINF